MNLTPSSVSVLAGAALLFVMPVPATAHPDGHEECLSFPTHAEMLAEYGYSADDEGLLAAARSGNPAASDLAFRAAYDLGSDVLISEALIELSTIEGWLLEPNFQAARYLEKQGRAEGTDHLRQIADTPMAVLLRSRQISVALKAIRILAERGDGTFAPKIEECMDVALPAEAVFAIQALAAFPNPAVSEVESAWLAAAERLTVFVRSDDPRHQSGASLYAGWLSSSVREQTVVTQRIRDAFDAIVLPPDRDDVHGRIARSLDSARAHWATCELVPSEEPPPAEQPADPQRPFGRRLKSCHDDGHR